MTSARSILSRLSNLENEISKQVSDRQKNKPYAIIFVMSFIRQETVIEFWPGGDTGEKKTYILHADEMATWSTQRIDDVDIYLSMNFSPEKQYADLLKMDDNLLAGGPEAKERQIQALLKKNPEIEILKTEELTGWLEFLQGFPALIYLSGLIRKMYPIEED